MPNPVSISSVQHTNDPLVRSFERHLRAEARSESTRVQYIGSANLFLTWLADQDAATTVLTAKRADIEEWLAGLHGTLRPATVRYRYLGLRAFYDWLADEEEIRTNPFGRPDARRIRPPELPESPKDVATQEQLNDVFKLLDRHRRWRDAVVLSVLYGTGMRASELADTLSEHVDIGENGTIYIPKAKSRRTRTVMLPPRTTRYIDRYWRMRPDKGGRKDDRWLVNGTRGQMTRSGIYQVVRQCFEAAGVKNVIIGAHDLRHTSATHVAASGIVGESDAMVTYGWSTPEMWRRYTDQARQKSALAAMRKADPMAQLGTKPKR